MVDLDHQEPGEVLGRPALVEVIGLLLLDPVVAGQVEALGIVRLQIRVRRGGAEAGDVVREVAVEHHQRVVGVRMGVEPLRHQHMGAQIDRSAPEGRERLALDPDVADVGGVGLGRDRRDLLVEAQGDPRRMRRVHMHLDRPGIEIARLGVPVLALAHVRRQLHHRPIGPVEGLVAVQHRLRPIVPGLQGREAPRRPAERLGVHHRRLARLQAVHIVAEHERRGQGLVLAPLGARFALGIGGEQQDDPAIQGLGLDRGGEADREAGAGGGGLAGRLGVRGDQQPQGQGPEARVSSSHLASPNELTACSRGRLGDAMAAAVPEPGTAAERLTSWRRWRWR